MNSTPKQQDGESSSVAAAHGPAGALEQTFLGVAPAAPAPVSIGAPPAAPVAPLPVAAPGSAAAAVMVAPMISVADRSPAASSSRTSLAPGSGDAHAAGPERDVFVTPAPAPVTLPAGSPAHVLAATPPIAPTKATPPAPGSAVGPGATLPIVPIAGGGPRAQASAAAAEAPLERTVLTEDYLREARAAALAQVAAAPTGAGNTLPVVPRPSSRVAAPEAPSAAPPVDTTRPSLALPSVAPPSSHGSTAPGGKIGGFEPVPVARAPLAESMSGGLGPVGEVGGTRHPWSSTSSPRLPVRPRGTAGGRVLLLAAVALASVGVVSFGSKLLERQRASRLRERALAAAEAAPLMVAGAPASGGLTAPGPASRALLANRPAPALGAQALVISATGMPGGEASAPSPGADVPAGKSPALASPESQLAATAARHVLSGNYADALPVYQQLERSSPENTAYAAMTRLLKKKVGTSSDTRSVAPAPSPTR